MPDVSLCLSTNGLTLYRHVDEIMELGIRHVTITINAIDPEVGQAIYPWVFDEGVRYEGREAAELLIRRQLLGLEMLAKLGILVKVNSIMIPGVNDHHLTAVSARVKELGATLHNVTPLIIAPGSQYEADGRKAPRPKELLNLQEQLGRGGMKVMRRAGNAGPMRSGCWARTAIPIFRWKRWKPSRSLMKPPGRCSSVSWTPRSASASWPDRPDAFRPAGRRHGSRLPPEAATK